MKLARTLVVLAPCLVVGSALAQVSFTIQELSPVFHSQSFANDVNDTPAVAGTSANSISNPTSARAILWQAGTTTNLSSLGFDFSSANAINANGVVVGYVSSPFISEYWAARWFAGSANLLDVPAGGTRSFANDVHANGTIVGQYSSPSGVGLPCTWSASGVFAALPLPAGAVGGEANMIRGDGVIVGAVSMASGGRHACSWTNGVATDLSPNTTETLHVAALLPNGDVVGSRSAANSTPVLVSGGVVQSLPTLAGGRGGCADANAAGWIVGWSSDAAQQWRAVVYIGGAILDLNTLTTGASGWTLVQATGVSDQGRICGYGLLNGQTRAFLLTPECAVTSYCTAGVSTNGCAGAMSASGAPSASLATPFTVTASGVEGQKLGLLFYGVSGRSSAPWGATSSVLCVKAPTQRTGSLNSGGAAGACDGVLTLDWNAYQSAHPGALGQPFQAGDTVNLQGWYRDPPSAKTTALTDALEARICP